jgi:serine/threonine protein kinase
MVDEYGNIKIIDFGLSELLLYGSSKDHINYYISSKHIEAPDDQDIPYEYKFNNGIMIFNTNRKTYTSDIFSIGQTMLQGIYNMIYNNFIFTKEGLFSKSIEYDDTPYLKIDINIINEYSDSLLSLIRGMINTDSEKRFTAKQCLEHEYFNKKEDNKIDNNSIITGLKNVTYNEPFKFIFKKQLRNPDMLIDKYAKYNSNEIINSLYELSYMEDIHKNYINDILIPSKILFKNDLITQPIMNRIIEQLMVLVNHNYADIDSFINTILKLNNYHSAININNLESLELTQLYAQTRIFEYYPIDKTNLLAIRNSYSENDFIKMFRSIIDDNITSFFQFTPIMIHIQYIVIKLQIMNIISSIIVNIEEQLFKGILQWAIFNVKYNYNIWDIIQVLFIRLPIDMGDIKNYDFITIDINSKIFKNISSFFSIEPIFDISNVLLNKIFS